MFENKMNQSTPTIQLIELLQKKRRMGYTTLSNLFKRIKGQEDVMLTWVLQHPDASDEEIISASFEIAGLSVETNIGNTLKGITRWIPEIENMTAFGEWHFENLGFFALNDTASVLVYSIFEFMERNPAYKKLPHSFFEVLAKHGLDYRNGNAILAVDPTQMDISGILSMFLSVTNAERINPGSLAHFFHKGVILRWLKRLEELEEHPN